MSKTQISGWYIRNAVQSSAFIRNNHFLAYSSLKYLLSTFYLLHELRAHGGSTTSKKKLLWWQYIFLCSSVFSRTFQHFLKMPSLDCFPTVPWELLHIYQGWEIALRRGCWRTRWARGLVKWYRPAGQHEASGIQSQTSIKSEIPSGFICESHTCARQEPWPGACQTNHCMQSWGGEIPRFGRKLLKICFLASLLSCPIMHFKW